MGTVVKLTARDERRRRLVQTALAPELLIGMPHLTPFGLSETWLLKELAHRHWLMLGQSMGLDDANFRMPDGGEVYAAICASALRRADLGSVKANDILTISSCLSPVSRTRMSSIHVLAVDGRPIGEVELVSAFVHRSDAGQGNIARVRLPTFESLGYPDQASELASRSDQLRRGGFAAAGFALPGGPVRDQYRFTPSQLQDFNGAGLFYFASFSGTIDRAVEEWWGSPPRAAHRELHYLGNIAAGQSVVVSLLDVASGDITITRDDGYLIAYQHSKLLS